MAIQFEHNKWCVGDFNYLVALFWIFRKMTKKGKFKNVFYLKAFQLVENAKSASLVAPLILLNRLFE